MEVIWGYVRVSTKIQNMERQIENIKALYPTATIYQEEYTGTKIDRPQFGKLLKKVKEGDTIVFDSVSRMSRNAEEGVKTYFELYDRGVNLIFLNERHIDTETYKAALQNGVPLTGTDADPILEGVNTFLRSLARKQIILAFEQSQKEVDDLHSRTAQGMAVARASGKQIGRATGTVINTAKSVRSKEIILKHSKTFGGSLEDKDIVTLCGISRKTLYKYKKQLKAEEEKRLDDEKKTGKKKKSV